METDGNRLRFVARDVPPMGYRTYVPVKPEGSTRGKVRSADKAGANVLESACFRVALDASHGTVASLIERRSGRELVEGSAQPGFGQYLYERFDRGQVQAYVVDRYDRETGTSSMARTTGYTCTATVRLLAAGLYRRPGLAPLELVGGEPGCAEFILADLARRGVTLRETVGEPA